MAAVAAAIRSWVKRSWKRRRPAAPKRRRSWGSGQYAREHRGQRRGILGRNEKAGSAVDDDFFAADHTGGDDRQSGVHRFEQDERHPLVTRRQREHVRSVEEESSVPAMPDQAHAVADAEPRRLVEQRLLQMTGREDDDRQAGNCPARRAAASTR